MSSIVNAAFPIQDPTLSCILDEFLQELLWFIAGAVVVYLLMLVGVIPQWNGPGPLEWVVGISKERAARRRCAIKQLCAAATAGQNELVLEAWDREKSRGAMPSDALEDVTTALAILAPQRLVSDLAEHMTRYPKAYTQPSMINVLLEVLVRSGHKDMATSLCHTLHQRLGVFPDSQTRAILMERPSTDDDRDDHGDDGNDRGRIC